MGRILKKIKIRFLKEHEIDEAVRIVCKNYTPSDARWARMELREMFTDKFNYPRVIVAIKEKKMVGFAVYAWSWIDSNVAELFWVNVLPSCRKEGVGSALIKEVIRRIEAIPDNFKYKPQILILSCKKRLRKYYQRFGFKTITDVNRHNILMQRNLKGRK